MAIRTTRVGEVERLVGSLLDGSSVQREAAVARLRVIGSRAVERLAALLASDAPPTARAAALEALADSDDQRTLDLGLSNLAHAEADVAVAATGVLRGWVPREQGTRVLDALSAAALDQTRHARVRLAALDALASLPRDVVRPLLEHVRGDDAAEAGDDALSAREWLASHQDAPLTALHAFVVRAREQEQQEASARRREDWLVTRAAAHALLARRGSRLALYDLRETFDAAQRPLPLDFLTAVTEVGDASCLEPMARAWKATSEGERWWRDRVADAAADIMHRTRLSGRSALVKRIRVKWSGFL